MLPATGTLGKKLMKSQRTHGYQWALNNRVHNHRTAKKLLQCRDAFGHWLMWLTQVTSQNYQLQRTQLCKSLTCFFACGDRLDFSSTRSWKWTHAAEATAWKHMWEGGEEKNRWQLQVPEISTFSTSEIDTLWTLDTLAAWRCEGRRKKTNKALVVCTLP